MASFQEGFKKARKAVGLTQAAFADKYHYSIATVKKWEQGKAKPEVETLLTLCDIFNCDMSYLFGQIDSPKHTTVEICNETGLSQLAVEKLTKMNRISSGNDFWKTAIDYVSFLLESSSSYITDKSFLTKMAVESDQCVCAKIEKRHHQNILNNLKPTDDDERLAIQEWIFTDEWTRIVEMQTKAIDSIKMADESYSAHLFHLKEEASKSVEEFTKRR